MPCIAYPACGRPLFLLAQWKIICFLWWTYKKKKKKKKGLDKQMKAEKHQLCTETFFIHTISTPAMLEVNVSIL